MTGWHRSEGVLRNDFACANTTSNRVDPGFRIRGPDLRMGEPIAIERHRAGWQADASKLKKEDLL
ncbi:MULTISPECIES: hypothetical protein [Burkholderia]|uniref:hypothetical protein n=1 Tax=Burkholderia TaxID=32008 RepID=UPI00117CF86A|nr:MULTISPECIES: hypothetical protein [Burkholderia]